MNYVRDILWQIKHNSFSKDNKLMKDFTLNNDPDFKPTKDNIRRLFMLIAFGNDKQLSYFKNECEKEFGEIGDI